jgi:hypothetical protein
MLLLVLSPSLSNPLLDLETGRFIKRTDPIIKKIFAKGVDNGGNFDWKKNLKTL